MEEFHKKTLKKLKMAIIELMYPFHYQSVFINENADIRLIAGHFEEVFNVNLENFYQTYLELRNRKMNQTKFLGLLRKMLIKKREEQDEKQEKKVRVPYRKVQLKEVLINSCLLFYVMFKIT